MKTILLTLAALAATNAGLMAFPFATPSVVRSDFGRVAGVADFNRDGRADILMASTHDLVWMRHTTGTSFTQAAILSWPTATVVEVLTPDIDGDGDTDVVLNTAGLSQLIILRNDGNFVFTKVLEAAVGTNALLAGAVVGDYDNDGDLDAGLFHTVTGDTVRRLAWAANAAGVFTLQAPTQNVSSIFWLKALTADFNQDGFMDMAMGDTNVSISRGTPSGVFLPWPDITFSGSITHMETGDIDRDGFPDLVLTSGNSLGLAQRSAWCRWNGAGFNAPSTIQNHTTGRVRGTHLVDVDEDGDLDAVYGDQAFYVDNSNQGAHQILWAENSGGSFLIAKVLHTASEAAEIFSGDVDGDGDMDIVYSANGDVQMTQNTAIHRTAEFDSNDVVNGASPLGDMCAADMDNDGEGDLLWSRPASNLVMFGSGHRVDAADNKPVFHSFTYISSSIPGAGALAAGDLNHDGLTDAVIAANGIGQLQIASRSSGSWQISNAAPLPVGTTELVVTDVDLDGNNDIVIGHDTGITLLRGSGGFTPTWTAETVVNNIGPVTKICPVQLNGAGRMELMAMTVETSPARCRIYRYAWSSVFGLWQNPSAVFEGDSASSLLAIGDANRDNARDVFYAVTGDVNCAPSGVTLLGFGASKPLGPISGMRCGESADFNNDGVMDLAAAGGGLVVIYIGLGNGSFAAPYGIFSKAGAALNRMAVYDFEHDGDMDIMVADDTGNQVEVLYNTCGHFDLTELGMGEVIPATASAAPVAMHLSFTHGGRAGDASASLRSLRFRLLAAVKTGDTITPGAGLTTAEATALLAGVEVYNDVGEPMNFESGIDPLVGSVGPATSIGYLTVTPTSIAIAPGQTLRLWVRPRMSANAGSSAIRSFFLQHITDPAAAGTLIAHAGATTFRLDPMLIDEASVRIVVPGTLENWRFTHWGQYDSTGSAANYADADGDGVNNIIEYYTGTNPTVGEPSLNAAAALQVLPLPTMQSPVNYRVIANAAAFADPRVRMSIYVATDLKIWNYDAGASGGLITRGSPTIQTVSGSKILTFPTGHTPLTKPKYFVRMGVEELP
jgi:hypothetical protein